MTRRQRAVVAAWLAAREASEKKAGGSLTEGGMAGVKLPAGTRVVFFGMAPASDAVVVSVAGSSTDSSDHGPKILFRTGLASLENRLRSGSRTCLSMKVLTGTVARSRASLKVMRFSDKGCQASV